MRARARSSTESTPHTGLPNFVTLLKLCHVVGSPQDGLSCRINAGILANVTLGYKIDERLGSDGCMHNFAVSLLIP